MHASSDYTEEAPIETTHAAVKRFVSDELLPAAQRSDRDRQFPDDIVERMKRLGLFGTIIPREYGGLGLSMAAHVAIIEEVARGWISMAGVLNPPRFVLPSALAFGQ